MRENASQINSEYGHLLSSVMETIDFQMTAKFLTVNCGFWTDNEKTPQKITTTTAATITATKTKSTKVII